MDALMLDGNAVAGLLQEVFAVEVTTAIGNVRHTAARPARWEQRMSIEGRDSSCAARTATTHSSRLCEVTNGCGSTSRGFEHWKPPSSAEH